MSRACSWIVTEADLGDRLDQRAHQLGRERRAGVDARQHVPQAGFSCSIALRASSIRSAMSGCERPPAASPTARPRGTQKTFSPAYSSRSSSDSRRPAPGPRRSRRSSGRRAPPRARRGAARTSPRCTSGRSARAPGACTRPTRRAAQLVRRLEERRAVRTIPVAAHLHCSPGREPTAFFGCVSRPGWALRAWVRFGPR